MPRTILALVALIACRDKQSELSPPPPPRDHVALIQPGAAPFHTLRYHLRKGAQATSELVFDLDARNDGEGGPMPTLVVELSTTVDDVLADGTAKLRITVGRTGVRDRPGGELASDLVRGEAAAMQGVVITETLAPDGKVSDAQVQIAAALPDKPHTQLDSLSQSLERLAMRLPSEPVGIGATWREREALPEGGIRAVAETTYTLTSLTGDTVAYTSAGLTSGAPQTLEQDGLKVEVTSVRGHAEARGTVDLSRYALDVTSTTALMTAMTIVAPAGTPGAGSSTVDVTVALRLTPTAPDAGSAQGAHRAPDFLQPPPATSSH